MSLYSKMAYKDGKYSKFLKLKGKMTMFTIHSQLLMKNLTSLLKDIHH